ncbi:E3 ubiquitin-protein ligase TRIM35-like [Pagrus major]|uniref:E3 ubiquitin-protein ligase TRIM35-like n=1 Tax=Pagrus major TaxID=143350 RepID=UPI003CC8DB99
MTTPVSIPKLLKEYLDDLTEERLREFQWHLVQIQVDGSRPILRSRLENATREATVNILVEVFGEDGAVARTVDTFFRMNLNDLASKLVRAKMDQTNQSMEQQVDEPGTSSAREEPREVDPTVPQDLSCSICLSLFTDPVVLHCGHSFCRTCVQEDWEKNIVRECSLCKQFIPEGDPPINFSLKSWCESYRGRSQGEPSGGHSNDTESFQTRLKNIKEKQEKVKQLCDSSIERIKTQSCNTENKITDDFNMLRALLDKEEKTRRDALREEARLKIRMIHLIHDTTKNTFSLSDTVKEIGKFGAGERFISTCGTIIKRMERALRKLRAISQAQVNVSEHVENLPLTVLEKMLNDRKRTSVVLDPETASSCPSVSDHPTKVKVNDTRQLCPGNTECSTRYQQDLQKSPKRMRVEQDYELIPIPFSFCNDYTSTQTHPLQFEPIPFDFMPPLDYFGIHFAKAEAEAEVEVESESSESKSEVEAGNEV